jgi:hypothetical protein
MKPARQGRAMYRDLDEASKDEIEGLGFSISYRAVSISQLS